MPWSVDTTDSTSKRHESSPVEIKVKVKWIRRAGKPSRELQHFTLHAYLTGLFLPQLCLKSSGREGKDTRSPLLKIKHMRGTRHRRCWKKARRVDHLGLFVPRVDSDSKQFNPEAPFGYVDPELKAYFRTVDDQLKEWQQNREYYAEGEEDIDPNESASCFFLCTLAVSLSLSRIDRRMFLMAALQEISGKERELATDPDCAAGLERMAYSMDDFVRRVFMDSLTSS